MNKISKLSLIVLAIMYPSLQVSAKQQNAQEEMTEQEIETITVVSRTLNLYRNGESTTAKLAVDPLNSTQMITSLNANLIHDLGARDAKDLYRNIAGVSQFSYAGVTARGFRQEEIYFDGLRGDPYVGFNVPQLFNVERVDFLKGPSGMLYGLVHQGGYLTTLQKSHKQNLVQTHVSSLVQTTVLAALQKSPLKLLKHKAFDSARFMNNKIPIVITAPVKSQ